MTVTWVFNRLTMLEVARILRSLATSLATNLTVRNVCGLPERQWPARNGNGLTRSGVRLAIRPSGSRPASPGAPKTTHRLEPAECRRLRQTGSPPGFAPASSPHQPDPADAPP